MSRIRISIVVGLIIIGVGLAPWGRAAESTPAKSTAPAKSDREQALERLLADRADEIDKLKSENARLKQELRELQSRQPAILPPVPSLRLDPPAAAVPKNAVPRQFNGETYYLVPLTAGEERPTISGTGTITGTSSGKSTLTIRGENQNHRPASNLPVTQPGR